LHHIYNIHRRKPSTSQKNFIKNLHPSTILTLPPLTSLKHKSNNQCITPIINNTNYVSDSSQHNTIDQYELEFLDGVEQGYYESEKLFHQIEQEAYNNGYDNGVNWTHNQFREELEPQN